MSQLLSTQYSEHLCTGNRALASREMLQLALLWGCCETEAYVLKHRPSLGCHYFN